MKKTLVIIAARGIGDLIYHLPLLRSLHESYKEKLIILSNKVNHSKEVYKFETFYKEIIEFENTRFSFFKTLKKINNLKNIINKCNVDQLILTASSRRLMLPVYLSNVKEKIIKYTDDLNLPVKSKDFFLTPNQIIEKDQDSSNTVKLFITLDSHHDQNNWSLKNYITIISKIIQHNVKIFINFSPPKLYFLDQIPKKIINSNKIKFTHNENILEIMNIINSCTFVIGNETGPICLGASLKKEVHSIYLPIHTKPESQIISNKTHYYNADKEKEIVIIEKITNSILIKLFHD